MMDEHVLAVPDHSALEHKTAHRGTGTAALAVSTRILAETPSIAEAVGVYLRAAALSHPSTFQEGHCHPIITRAVIGSYSLILTLERGFQEHPNRAMLPELPDGSLALWYWHFSLVRSHEDTGALLPAQIAEAVKMAEVITKEVARPEWFSYGINPHEPLVLHAWIPYQQEAEE